MNREAELLKALFSVARGDLDQAMLPMANLGRVTDEYRFVRIARLASFWRRGDRDERLLLHQAVCDLLAGFHGLRESWSFLLEGDRNTVRCWYGMRHGSRGMSTLKASLAGVYPNLLGIEDDRPDLKDAAQWPHIVALTGYPTSRAERGDDQIERLCRGMRGARWLYLVQADPIPVPDTVRDLNRLSSNINDVHATYLLKDSAIDHGNRLALNLVSMLEEEHERLQRGRATGMWDVRTVLASDQEEALERGRGLLLGAFSGDDSSPVPVRACKCGTISAGRPDPAPLNTQEAAVLASPPTESYPGFEIIDDRRYGVSPPAAQDSHPAVRIGEIHDRGAGTGHAFTIPKDHFTRHGLIVGVTGSGKTNSCFSLLDQVWDGGLGAPFLVVESAKSEYRSLIRHPRFRDLQVFTVGDETVSPLRLNPFEVPDGILVQSHIDYLKSLFAAAFVLPPPMPYILDLCLQRIYQERGWDLSANRNDRGDESARRFPTLSDLSDTIPEVVDEMGYDDRLRMDVQAGLTARIRNLAAGGGKGPMLAARTSTPDDVLFASPCILELKSLVSDDEKAFLIGLIMIRLYEYCETRIGPTDGHLRHLILIEEAHRLLRNTSTDQSSEIAANPRGKAIEVFSNILSEIRAFGEGVFLAEQIPIKLAPDALKNTNFKLVHRLAARDDREAIGSTINLEPERTRGLSTLPLGEGLAFAEGMEQPALIRVERFGEGPGAARVNDGELASHMADFHRGHENIMKPYLACVRCKADERRRCSTAPSRRKSTPTLDADFQRLVNAMRWSGHLVSDLFGDFARHCRRDPGAHGGSDDAYCRFVALAESEIEKRSTFLRWSFEDTDAVIESACDIAWYLDCGIGSEGKAVFEKEFDKKLRRFSYLMETLEVVDEPPYSGCSFCDQPCRYRFDMSRSPDSTDSRDFRALFRTGSGDWSALAGLCLDTAGRSVSRNDLRSLQGAALCFAVQQVGSLDMSGPVQVDCLRYVLAALKNNPAR